jgi:hypothetical protein
VLLGQGYRTPHGAAKNECNDDQEGEPKNSKCHFVHQESHLKSPGTEPGSPWSSRLSYGAVTIEKFPLESFQNIFMKEMYPILEYAETCIIYKYSGLQNG